MKLNKFYVLIVLILVILNISTRCSAKYVFECTKTAAKIEIKN